MARELLGMKVRTFIKKYMGRQVRFTRKLVRRSERDAQNRLIWYWAEMPLDDHTDASVGWAVGLRWLPRGHVVDYDFNDGGRQFRSCGRAIPAVLVATYPTVNPIPIPLDNIEVLDEPVEIRLWPKRFRVEMAKDSKEWPRDERGRWVKDYPSFNDPPGPGEGGP